MTAQTIITQQKIITGIAGQATRQFGSSTVTVKGNVLSITCHKESKPKDGYAHRADVTVSLTIDLIKLAEEEAERSSGFKFTRNLDGEISAEAVLDCLPKIIGSKNEATLFDINFRGHLHVKTESALVNLAAEDAVEGSSFNVRIENERKEKVTAEAATAETVRRYDVSAGNGSDTQFTEVRGAIPYKGGDEVIILEGAVPAAEATVPANGHDVAVTRAAETRQSPMAANGNGTATQTGNRRTFFIPPNVVHAGFQRTGYPPHILNLLKSPRTQTGAASNGANGTPNGYVAEAQPAATTSNGTADTSNGHATQLQAQVRTVRVPTPEEQAAGRAETLRRFRLEREERARARGIIGNAWHRFKQTARAIGNFRPFSVSKLIDNVGSWTINMVVMKARSRPRLNRDGLPPYYGQPRQLVRTPWLRNQVEGLATAQPVASSIRAERRPATRDDRNGHDGPPSGSHNANGNGVTRGIGFDVLGVDALATAKQQESEARVVAAQMRLNRQVEELAAREEADRAAGKLSDQTEPAIDPRAQVIMNQYAATANTSSTGDRIADLAFTFLNGVRSIFGSRRSA